MRLLLTGSSGQVGWELARTLLPLGELIVLNRSQADFSEPESLRSVVRELMPDVIVNAAAYTAVDKAEENEETAGLINGKAPGILAEEAHRTNALLVHYSTDYVFDGSKRTPYREDDGVNPLNAYGRSKLSGETAIRNTGCNFLIVRTAWVYATRGKNFLLTMLNLMQDRESLRVVDDQSGSPTWSRLIAEVTAIMLRQSLSELQQGTFQSDTFHLASAGYTSWYGFARQIAEIAAGQQRKPLAIRNIVAVTSREYPTPARRPVNSRLDTRKLEGRFNLILPAWDVTLRLCMQELR